MLTQLCLRPSANSPGFHQTLLQHQGIVPASSLPAHVSPSPARYRPAPEQAEHCQETIALQLQAGLIVICLHWLYILWRNFSPKCKPGWGCVAQPGQPGQGQLCSQRGWGEPELPGCQHEEKAQGKACFELEMTCNCL